MPRWFRGDPDRLRQILVNLLGNAVKFTEHGSVTVGVAVASVQAAGTLLRFEVRDTGPGISQDGMGRLFGLFAQVDSSSTRRHGGEALAW